MDYNLLTWVSWMGNSYFITMGWFQRLSFLWPMYMTKVWL